MESLKYTYLFGGGAIRGAAHVGVLKALQELGAEPDTLGGSSVGSIVAALYAVGYTTEELQEIFLSVNFELFRDISFGFNTKFALSKGEVFLDWFRELIEKKFYGDKYDKGNNKRVKFKDLTKNLIIISTNMLDFTCCEFSNFETPDFEVAMAVRISCCMPGLMRAINVEDKLLVDGDLMKGKPMWYLSKNLRKSKNRILEIRLEGEFSGDDKSPVTYVNGMYSCMTYSETSFIKELYGNSDNYDYLVINTGDVVVVDFNYPPEKRQQIIDSGYEQTIKYFKEFLPQKKKHLFDIYDEILDRFRNIQGFMLRKKYSKAKTSIAELYILLAKEKDIISQSIYKEINEFQKLLYSNVKTGLLGHSYLENKNLTEAQLRKVIDILTEHFNEFKNYFKQFPV
jgi:NTE family protein